MLYIFSPALTDHLPSNTNAENVPIRYLEQVHVSLFYQGGIDPERWSDSPIVTQLIGAEAEAQTQASELVVHAFSHLEKR